MAEPKLLIMEEVPSENNKRQRIEESMEEVPSESNKRQRQNSEQAAKIEEMFAKALITVCTQRENAHYSLKRELDPLVEKAMRLFNYVPKDITSTELTSEDLVNEWQRLKGENWQWSHPLACLS